MKKINRYDIEYRGKKYIYTGKNCEEAMEKFSHRKVFGQNLIYDYRIRMYDADTLGDEWAQYYCDHAESLALVNKI